MLGAIIITHEMEPRAPNHLQRLRVALADHAEQILVFTAPPGVDGVESIPLPPPATALSAIATVLAHAGDDHALVAAADLLHPSSELMRYLVHVRAGFEAIVPVGSDGVPQPLLALYHPRCARRALGLVSAGEHDPLRLLELATVRLVTADEVAKFGEPERLLARARPGAHSAM